MFSSIPNLSAAQTLSSTGETKVKLNTVITSRGTDFTLSTTNNTVTCNFNGYIEVSGQVQFSNAANTTTHNLYIRKNSTTVGRSLNAAYTNGGNKTVWITPIIISVSNGDAITLECYGSNNDRVNDSENGTNMTVKRI